MYYVQLESLVEPVLAQRAPLNGRINHESASLVTLTSSPTYIRECVSISGRISCIPRVVTFIWARYVDVIYMLLAIMVHLQEQIRRRGILQPISLWTLGAPYQYIAEILDLWSCLNIPTLPFGWTWKKHDRTIESENKNKNTLHSYSLVPRQSLSLQYATPQCLRSKTSGKESESQRRLLSPSLLFSLSRVKVVLWRPYRRDLWMTHGCCCRQLASAFLRELRCHDPGERKERH